MILFENFNIQASLIGVAIGIGIIIILCILDYILFNFYKDNQSEKPNNEQMVYNIKCNYLELMSSKTSPHYYCSKYEVCLDFKKGCYEYCSKNILFKYKMNRINKGY
jgi:hypothetical protein